MEGCRGLERAGLVVSWLLVFPYGDDGVCVFVFVGLMGRVVVVWVIDVMSFVFVRGCAGCES